MRILFAVNNDSILNTVVDLLKKENVSLVFNRDNDIVSTRELVIEKLKYNLKNENETKYDIVLLSEKLEGEYDLLEICRFSKRNKVRPIILMGQKRDDDPFIHALIKRKIYDFLYGKLSFRDIINCILIPRKYEDIEYLVDQVADDYTVVGNKIQPDKAVATAQPIEQETRKDEETEDTSNHDNQKELPQKGKLKIASISKKIKLPNLNIAKKPISQQEPEEERYPVKVNKTVEVRNESGRRGRGRRIVPQDIDFKRSIAIFSNQQVGKSFIASNLAAVYASNGISTMLVDLDFKNKSQYYYFNFSNYEKKAQNIDEIDGIKRAFEASIYDNENILQLFFNPLKNLHVITSHPDIMIKEYDVDSLSRVFSLLKSIFKVVIYDLPSNCSPEYLKFIMTQVDDIVIVTNQNCNVLDRTEKDIRDVAKGFFINNKVNIVINQFIPHGIINKKSIIDHLSQISSPKGDIRIKFKNVFTIPNDYELLVKSITEGRPAVMADHEMLHAFLDIAVMFYPSIKY